MNAMRTSRIAQLYCLGGGGALILNRGLLLLEWNLSTSIPATLLPHAAHVEVIGRGVYNYYLPHTAHMYSEGSSDWS